MKYKVIFIMIIMILACSMSSVFANDSTVSIDEPNIEGDLNNDSKVDSIDLRLMKGYILLGKVAGINFLNADIDSDGRIDSLDCILLKKLILKPSETLDEQFKFKIKTTNANEVYNFPIKEIGWTYITVDWGDGTTSKITGYRSHTYASAGTYIVKVISFLQMPISFQYDGNLIEVITPIPNIGASDFNGCFFGCSNLTTIPSGLFDNNPNVTDFTLCFYGCRSLTTIPSGLFDNNSNVTDFTQCFSDCRSLTTIPASLFDNNSNVTEFVDCFNGCKSLTTIPAELFGNNPNFTEFAGCFANCSSLTSIPAGVFDNVNVVSFDWCFMDCSSLTGLAPALWLRSPKLNGKFCFLDCTKLSNYADIPSNWK